MSATANWFVPGKADPEVEREVSPPLPTVHFDGNRQNLVEETVAAGWCEAIVSHYESGLNAANGVILHLGAGRGELMETFRQHGFLVMGCEASPSPTRLARAAHGFDARTLHCSGAGNFLRWVKDIGQKAQAIFFQHGWEHNLELQALLPRMAEILRAGGRVIALLPPPAMGYPRAAHVSLLNELAVAGATSTASFEVERVDCDVAGRFMAFVLKKVAPARAAAGCGRLPARFLEPASPVKS